MQRSADLIKFADEVYADVVMYDFYVDGERHNRQTRGEINSCQHDDEHGRCQLIAGPTEHNEHDNVAGNSADAEDEQYADHNVEFNSTGRRHLVA